MSQSPRKPTVPVDNQLLVSIRSPAEAALVFRFLHDNPQHSCLRLIDLKDPAGGAMGRVSRQQMETIFATGSGMDRFPRSGNQTVRLSAAMGDLDEFFSQSWPDSSTGPDSQSRLDLPASVPDSLAFLKFGLPDFRRVWPATSRWVDRWRSLKDVQHGRGLRPEIELVPVLYADRFRWTGPGIEAFVEQLIRIDCQTVLVDTFAKSRGSNLFDFAPVEVLQHFQRAVSGAGARVALAGSITLENIRQAVRIAPILIGVRGAVCRNGRDELCPARLKEFVCGFESAVAERSPRTIFMPQ